MSVRKVETMLLQGNQYAKVATRVREFHSGLPEGKIETTPEFRDGWVMFRAVVTPDANKPARFFTGHSIGKVGTPKAYEKLETIAVGRALSFAGFLATGEIASCEEMDEFERASTIADDAHSSRLDALEAALGQPAEGDSQPPADKYLSPVDVDPIGASRPFASYAQTVAGVKNYLRDLMAEFMMHSSDADAAAALLSKHKRDLDEIRDKATARKDSIVAGNVASILDFADQIINPPTTEQADLLRA